MTEGGKKKKARKHQINTLCVCAGLQRRFHGCLRWELSYNSFQLERKL